jgi:hypothetical protein
MAIVFAVNVAQANEKADAEFRLKA